MDILFYHPLFNCETWAPHLQKILPQAHFYSKDQVNERQFDYVLVWKPTRELFAKQKNLKAIFILGAGVDALLEQLSRDPDLLPHGVPVYRLQDTGMVIQMQEYTIATVFSYFRRLEDYRQQQLNKIWRHLAPYEYADFTIGVMGLGTLGAQVATRLAELGFPVQGWSRSAKRINNVTTYTESQLHEFLSGTRVLINLLPSTPDTQGILNKQLFSQLLPNAYVINIARGAHLIEEDLLTALASKQLKAATLDVFQQEPLVATHPFWHHPAITLTPHISAITRPSAASQQIAEKIVLLEQGVKVTDGLVDLVRGY